MVTIIKKDNNIQKSNNYKALCLLFASIAGSSFADKMSSEDDAEQVEQVVEDKAKGSTKKVQGAAKEIARKGKDAAKGAKKEKDTTTSPGQKASDVCDEATCDKGCGWTPYLLGAGAMWAAASLHSLVNMHTFSKKVHLHKFGFLVGNHNAKATTT